MNHFICWILRIILFSFIFSGVAVSATVMNNLIVPANMVQVFDDDVTLTGQLTMGDGARLELNGHTLTLSLTSSDAAPIARVAVSNGVIKLGSSQAIKSLSLININLNLNAQTLTLVSSSSAAFDLDNLAVTSNSTGFIRLIKGDLSIQNSLSLPRGVQLNLGLNTLTVAPNATLDFKAEINSAFDVDALKLGRFIAAGATRDNMTVAKLNVELRGSAVTKINSNTRLDIFKKDAQTGMSVNIDDLSFSSVSSGFAGGILSGGLGWDLSRLLSDGKIAVQQIIDGLSVAPALWLSSKNQSALKLDANLGVKKWFDQSGANKHAFVPSDFSAPVASDGNGISFTEGNRLAIANSSQFKTTEWTLFVVYKLNAFSGSLYQENNNNYKLFYDTSGRVHSVVSTTDQSFVNDSFNTLSVSAMGISTTITQRSVAPPNLRTSIYPGVDKELKDTVISTLNPLAHEDSAVLGGGINGTLYEVIAYNDSLDNVTVAQIKLALYRKYGGVPIPALRDTSISGDIQAGYCNSDTNTQSFSLVYPIGATDLPLTTAEANGVQVKLSTNEGRGIWRDAAGNSLSPGTDDGTGIYTFSGIQTQPGQATVKFFRDYLSPGRVSVTPYLQMVKGTSTIPDAAYPVVTGGQNFIFEKQDIAFAFSGQDFNSGIFTNNLPSAAMPQSTLSTAVLRVAGDPFDVYLAKRTPNCSYERFTEQDFTNLTFTINRINPDFSDIPLGYSGDSTVPVGAGANTFTPSPAESKLSITYNDVGSIQLVANSGNGPVGTASLGGTVFVVRPNSLRIVSITGSRKTATQSDDVDTPLEVAAAPFRVKFKAIGKYGSATPSFGYENIFSLITTSFALGAHYVVMLKLDSWAFSSDTLGSLSWADNDGKTISSYSNHCSNGRCACGSGTLCTYINYSEAGKFRFRVRAKYFSDTSSQNAFSDTWTVGRFIPAYFGITNIIAGTPTLMNNPATSSCGFTYMGAPLTVAHLNPPNPPNPPTIALIPKNKLGVPTKNYFNYESLPNSGEKYAGFENKSVFGVGDQPLLSSSNTSYPLKKEVIQNSIAVNFSINNPGSFSYIWNNNQRVKPFDAQFKFIIPKDALTDRDGVCYQKIPFSSVCDAFELDYGPQPIYDGRLFVKNASGTELLPLKVPVVAQYYNGTGFVTNERDSCTTIAADNIQLAHYQKGLSGVTKTSFPQLIRGKNNIILNSNKKTGQVQLALDLDGAGLGHLKYLFGNNTRENFSTNGFSLSDGNPTGLINFGTYRGRAPILFMRQIYGR